MKFESLGTRVDSSTRVSESASPRYFIRLLSLDNICVLICSLFDGGAATSYIGTHVASASAGSPPSNRLVPFWEPCIFAPEIKRNGMSHFEKVGVTILETIDICLYAGFHNSKILKGFSTEWANRFLILEKKTPLWIAALRIICLATVALSGYTSEHFHRYIAVTAVLLAVKGCYKNIYIPRKCSGQNLILEGSLNHYTHGLTRSSCAFT